MKYRTPRRPHKVARRGQTQVAYPFEAMRWGDWCDVPETLAPRHTVAGSARVYASKHRGYSFSTSTVKRPDGVVVTRVWRNPPQQPQEATA